VSSSAAVDRVAVIGCGFAGLAAARQLAGGPVEVTLIDQHNFHTFLPLLYQVATAGLDPADVAYPVRTIFRHDPTVVFRHGRVATVDLDRRRATLTDGSTVAYDHLIVGTGATAGFLGITGAVVGCMAGGGLSGLINAFGGISMPPQPGMSSALRIFFTPGAKTFFANGIWVLAASTAGALFPGMLSSRKGIAELLRAR